MTKCISCSKEISVKDKTCPHCGKAVRKKLGCIPIAGILVVGGIFIGVIIFAQNDDSRHPDIGGGLFRGSWSEKTILIEDRGCEPNLSAFSVRCGIAGAMSAPESQAELFPLPSCPECAQVINDRCLVRTQEGRRMVIVSGIVLTHYAVDDRIAEAHAMVNLVEQGWGDQNDVAGPSSVRLARCAGISSVSKTAAWPRWATLPAIRLGVRV